jgi:hypothetical protein
VVNVPLTAPVILPELIFNTPSLNAVVASTVPTTNISAPSVHLSVVSFHTNVLLGCVPRSISIPDVPSVTPAPVSPWFNIITLSVIAVLVVSS